MSNIGEGNKMNGTEKIKVGIIGTGNIGTDLLMKVLKSDVLECGIFAGHNPDSKGIAEPERWEFPSHMIPSGISRLIQSAAR